MTTTRSYYEELLELDWDFPDSDRSESIHGIHPYPAKFIPEIPASLIRILGVPEGTIVADPFCGSGVTLAEAQRAGHASVGIDLNPIACLISRVKTRPLPEHLLDIAEQIVATSANRSGQPVRVPSIPNVDHWFRPEVQLAILQITNGIQRVDDAAARDALSLALSSILVRVSNQESDTRYAAVEKDVTPTKVNEGFLNAVQRLSRVLNPHGQELPEAEVIQGDIRDVTPSDFPRPIGLVVTSPPYPNAYEYWLYHKYRMYWLGHDPIDVRQKEIGARAHYFRKNAPAYSEFREQMRHMLDVLKRCVAPGGHVCVVVGRSKIHGKIYDNASMIQEVAEALGYITAAVIERKIAVTRRAFNLSHANIRREHVIVLRSDCLHA